MHSAKKYATPQKKKLHQSWFPVIKMLWIQLGFLCLIKSRHMNLSPSKACLSSLPIHWPPNFFRVLEFKSISLGIMLPRFSVIHSKYVLHVWILTNMHMYVCIILKNSKVSSPANTLQWIRNYSEVHFFCLLVLDLQSSFNKNLYSHVMPLDKFLVLLCHINTRPRAYRSYYFFSMFLVRSPWRRKLFFFSFRI